MSTHQGAYNAGQKAAETNSPRPAQFDTYAQSQSWQQGHNAGSRK